LLAVVALTVVALLAIVVLVITIIQTGQLNATHLLWVVIRWGSSNVGAGVGPTICEFAINISLWYLVDLSRTVLASNNIGARSWADGLLHSLAVANGVSSLPHIGINVGKNVNAAIVVDVIDTVLL